MSTLHQPPLPAAAPARHAGDAEVEHLGLRAADHEDVGRLDVAMHDALAMRVGQRVGQALGDARGLHRVGPPAVGQQLAHVLALQPLHGDVHALGRQAGVVHRHDVGVREAGGGARFGEQLRLEHAALGRVEVGDVQHLHRDLPRQQRIERGVHRAEAAAAELVLEQVAADVRQRRQQLQCVVAAVHGRQAVALFGFDEEFFDHRGGEAGVVAGVFSRAGAAAGIADKGPGSVGVMTDGQLIGRTATTLAEIPHTLAVFDAALTLCCR